MAFTLRSLQKAVGQLTKTQGFERVLSKLNVVDASPGRCVCELKVEAEHLNVPGTLHGGLTSTLVDNVSTFALMTNDGAPPGVSVDLHVTFLKAAKPGDTIVIDSWTDRLGKTLAFLRVDIKNKDTDDLIAHGSHTKFVGQK